MISPDPACLQAFCLIIMAASSDWQNVFYNFHVHISCACAVLCSSYNLTRGAEDAIKLSTLTFVRAFPSHNHGAGVPKAAIVRFAQGLRHWM